MKKYTKDINELTTKILKGIKNEIKSVLLTLINKCLSKTVKIVQNCTPL